MLKFLFLAHRWLGIGLGLLVLLWCLSGFVMMYKAYPELSEQQYLASLPALSLTDCCQTGFPERVQDQAYAGFRLRMLADKAVLHLQDVWGYELSLDLTEQAQLNRISPARARAVSEVYARRLGLPEPVLRGQIERDQWTVSAALARHRPLYHFTADDAVGHQWYISSRSGELVQATTADQRLWGYLGAVIHWLYPTLLREQAQLWSQSVIWLSLLALFLTLTGLYLGLRQYKARRSGRRSPYRGWALWHHYLGLLFGVLTFTWLFSGLLSMNPAGLLSGTGARAEVQALRGEPLYWEEIDVLLARLQAASFPHNSVLLEGGKLGGELFVLSRNAQGETVRLDQHLRNAPLDPAQLHKLAARLAPAGSDYQAGLLHQEDAYYYSHHNNITLPVFRVVTESARYYLNPASGALLRKVDDARQQYRWLFNGLHRGDFNSLLRSRPLWDLFMWPLLLGVTGVALSGVVMGVRRLLPTRRRTGATAVVERQGCSDVS